MTCLKDPIELYIFSFQDNYPSGHGVSVLLGVRSEGRWNQRPWDLIFVCAHLPNGDRS